MTITTSLIQSMAEPLRPGEMILMKTFLAKQEYAVLNYNKHSEFSTSSYERYEFDWEKMRSNLTDGALQFFKNYETGKIDFTGPANAEFVITAIYDSAHGGGTNTTSNSENVITTVSARSCNSKINVPIEIVAFN